MARKDSLIRKDANKMRKYLIPNEGKFYKANMHTHTTVSDGKFTPEEMKELYKSHGYSILAYTDHQVMVPHPELADEDFLPIASYELAVNKTNPSGWPYTKTYHINFYAPTPDCSVSGTFCPNTIWLEHSKQYVTDEMRAGGMARHKYGKSFIQKLIDIANDEGFLVCYNHPNWSLQNHEDYSGLRGLWGVEWYNTGCERAGYHDTMQPIIDLLGEGNRMVYPIAADDSHSAAGAFGGFVQVKARELTYDCIFEALRRGEFYSSNGPEIYDLYVEDGKIFIKCSPVKVIFLCTDRRVIFRKNAPEGEMITEAEFDISEYIAGCSVATAEHNCYIRFDIKDGCEGNAHTRAYFIDELI